MDKIVDLIPEKAKVGHVTFLRYTDKKVLGFDTIECQCDCGEIFSVLAGYFINQRIKSCGCHLKRRLALGRQYGHFAVLEGPVRFSYDHEHYYYRVRCVICDRETWKARHTILKRMGEGCKCTKRHPEVRIGSVFDRLTVIAYVGSKEFGRKTWKCVCECGTFRNVPGSQLVRGITTSCGCKTRELRSKLRTTHGLSKEDIYHSWRAMIAKCDNKKCSSYPLYGGKGIGYSKAFGDIKTFIEEMGDTYEKGLCLIRHDKTADFSKENCAWVKPDEMRGNLPNAVILEEYRTGKMIPAPILARKYDLLDSTVRSRNKRGFDGLELIRPLKQKRLTPTEIRKIREWLKVFDIPAIAVLANKKPTLIRKIRDGKKYAHIK